MYKRSPLPEDIATAAVAAVAVVAAAAVYTENVAGNRALNFHAVCRYGDCCLYDKSSVVSARDFMRVKEFDAALLWFYGSAERNGEEIFSFLKIRWKENNLLVLLVM